MDGEFHIIVLEGLRHYGILHIWENIPRHPSQCNNDTALCDVIYYLLLP